MRIGVFTRPEISKMAQDNFGPLLRGQGHNIVYLHNPPKDMSSLHGYQVVITNGLWEIASSATGKSQTELAYQDYVDDQANVDTYASLMTRLADEVYERDDVLEHYDQQFHYDSFEDYPDIRDWLEEQVYHTHLVLHEGGVSNLIDELRRTHTLYDETDQAFTEIVNAHQGKPKVAAYGLSTIYNTHGGQFCVLVEDFSLKADLLENVFHDAGIYNAPMVNQMSPLISAVLACIPLVGAGKLTIDELESGDQGRFIRPKRKLDGPIWEDAWQRAAQVVKQKIAELNRP